jgi:hypothetical protein
MLVETGEVSDIFSTSAKIKGEILSAGDFVKQYGHCFAKTPMPTISDSKTEFSAAIGTGSFTSFLQDLDPGTKYYVRAYSNCNNNTVYGKEINFTTDEDYPPGITTSAVTGITQNSAVSGGNIISSGGIPVTARGVCWSTSPTPTIIENKTADGTGSGPYISNLTGLEANTTYYIRAYAVKTTGITYGNELSFTTAM